MPSRTLACQLPPMRTWSEKTRPVSQAIRSPPGPDRLRLGAAQQPRARREPAGALSPSAPGASRSVRACSGRFQTPRRAVPATARAPAARRPTAGTGKPPDPCALPHSPPRMRYSGCCGPSRWCGLGSKSDDLLIFSTRAEKGSGGVGAKAAGRSILGFKRQHLKFIIDFNVIWRREWDSDLRYVSDLQACNENFITKKRCQRATQIGIHSIIAPRRTTCRRAGMAPTLGIVWSMGCAR
jgi:hypothetical protein